MAREQRSTSKKKPIKHALPLTRRNYQIIGVALLCILLGYIALAQEPWDGTLPLVVAPILLFLGYCVLVPFGILYRNKVEQSQVDVHEEVPMASDAGAR
ncbi:MAG: hypothetical protein HBSIN02_09080 [Bacteroidia bacterium]|nr:MAG: hypothetical protein HBSIN02_09080 [Bacteroidia bacterium]